MTHTKRHGLKKKMGKGTNGKRKGKGTKRSSKRHLVDIGSTRPRITGQPGMNQNLAVTNALAKTMSQNRTMAQGLAQSQALGMGQSLA
jgi:hypothetical protein